jgi:hypothetical protein
LDNSINDAALLKGRFLFLLDQQHREQVYQEFIEKNTALVPREFIQNHGVVFDVVFRKIPLGNGYVTDFCFLSKSSADWNCVLIEIEKPQSRYFKKNSMKFHPDFQTALEQIDNWRAWFSNSSNKEGFVNGTLGQIRDGTHQPCDIKYVLVHGRRAEFEGNESRTSKIREKEREDFQILSYDSLVEALHSKRELYMAVKKNEFIEVLSNTFISEDLLTEIPPTYIKITDELRKSTLDNKKSWQRHKISTSSNTPQLRLILEDTLPEIGVLRVAER